MYKLTVLAITALCVLTQSADAQSEVTVMAEVPLAGYKIGAVESSSPSKEGFAIAFTPKWETTTILCDPATMKVKELAGRIVGQDCGLGLATVYDETNRKTQTYDVSSGRLLSSVMGTANRVGATMIRSVALGVDRYLYDYIDAYTGAQLIEFTEENSRQEVARPIWDDRKLRLLAFTNGSIVQTLEGFSIAKAVGQGFEMGASVLVSDAATMPDSIVGNPSDGSFSLRIRSILSLRFVTLDANLKKTKFQADLVDDISLRGVLGSMLLKDGDLNTFELKYKARGPGYGPTACWNPLTGEKRWQTAGERKSPVRWVGNYALFGRDLLNSETGKVVGQIPEGVFLASRKDIVWIVQDGEPPKLTVLRVN